MNIYAFKTKVAIKATIKTLGVKIYRRSSQATTGCFLPQILHIKYGQSNGFLWLSITLHTGHIFFRQGLAPWSLVPHFKQRLSVFLSIRRAVSFLLISMIAALSIVGSLMDSATFFLSMIPSVSFLVVLYIYCIRFLEVVLKGYCQIGNTNH